MRTFSEIEILEKIDNGETFEALLEEGSLEIRVLEYVPYICTAIHAGNRLQESLKQKCRLSDQERLREEDPYTDEMILSFPISLIGRDSRYEYDLNRSTEECVYTTAFKQKVWKRPLTQRQKQLSLEKHACYYRILERVVRKVREKFRGCLIFDLHSFNHKVPGREEAPVFNLGTWNLDMRQWKPLVTKLESELAKIKLPNMEVTVGRDRIFYGKGYQSYFSRNNLVNAPTIPLEVLKVFMDEESGELYPLVLNDLKKGLHTAILNTAAQFLRTLGRKKIKRSDLTFSEFEPIVFKVDKELFQLAKGINTLHYVNPINIQQEQKRFLSNPNRYTPVFRYRQLGIDPYVFREKLYRLPVSQIHDPILQGLYRATVNHMANKIDMIATVGTDKFLYNSLRYYGEPTPADIANAHFILYSPEIPNLPEEEKSCITAEDCKRIFEEEAKSRNMDIRVQLSNRIVAKAMVENDKTTLLVNRNVQPTQVSLNALIHHELGVHMVTTINGKKQPLKIFSLGFPNNTRTQEGLAILSEYLSGNLRVYRLKELALRVLAVQMMVSGMHFRQVFRVLTENHEMNEATAFRLCARVFRGGGFTKDYLYLRGLKDLLSYHQENDLTPLLCGKVSQEYTGVVKDLLVRGMIPKPHFQAFAMDDPGERFPVLDYLLTALR